MVEYLTLGLIGFPLEHSLSPRLHQAALKACGLAGEYRLYSIPTTLEGEARLREVLECMRRGEIQGLNVTIPHKQAVLPWLDELAPVARAIGAVNTIYTQDGRLIGDNTDAPGFWADLERFAGQDLKQPPIHALILGAGGSARAVAYALVEAGMQVTIAARRLGQAWDLAVQVCPYCNPEQVSCTRLDSSTLVGLLPELKLIVNTTPAGMAPHIETTPWPAGLPFPPGAVLYDLVYNPAETLLVREAREAGLHAATGLGMLVEQAALAFERWTGRTAPRDAMFQAAISSV